MRRGLARLLVPFALWSGVIGAFTAASACSGTSSRTIVPTTGILVRAETLTSGRGCGRDPNNLFKYVVVVFGYTEGSPDRRDSYKTPVTSNVFECFTDGTFISLDPVKENSTFRLEVYAYNEPAYAASRAVVDVAGTDTAALKTTTPTWTTQCSATQQLEVLTLAVCDPLAAGLVGLGGTVQPTKITVGTSSFRLDDGRLGYCSADGGVPPVLEAGAPDGGDAGDAGDAGRADAGDAGTDGGDAGTLVGPPVPFGTVRIRYRTAAVVGPTVDLACPETFLTEVPPEPAAYTIDIGVLDPAGQPVGTSTCSVTTQTGATSSAVCAP